MSTDLVDETNLTWCEHGEAGGDGEKTFLAEFTCGAIFFESTRQ